MYCFILYRIGRVTECGPWGSKPICLCHRVEFVHNMGIREGPYLIICYIILLSLVICRENMLNVMRKISNDLRRKQMKWAYFKCHKDNFEWHEEISSVMKTTWMAWEQYEWHEKISNVMRITWISKCHENNLNDIRKSWMSWEKLEWHEDNMNKWRNLDMCQKLNNTTIWP